jgi:hypothetical protein
MSSYGPGKQQAEFSSRSDDSVGTYEQPCKFNWRSVPGLFLAIVASFALGCVSIRPYDPGAEDELADNEGILVVHVDTDTAVESIVTSAGIVARSLEPGRYLILLAIPEGTYRWRRVYRKIGDWKIHWRIWPRFLDRDDRFTIKRGQINYPGLIQLRKSRQPYVLSVLPFNESAKMLLEIEQRQPGLAAKYTVRYAGSEPDEFLIRYQAVRDEKMRGDPLTRGKGKPEL